MIKEIQIIWTQNFYGTKQADCLWNHDIFGINIIMLHIPIRNKKSNCLSSNKPRVNNYFHWYFRFNVRMFSCSHVPIIISMAMPTALTAVQWNWLVPSWAVRKADVVLVPSWYPDTIQLRSLSRILYFPRLFSTGTDHNCNCRNPL